MFQKEVNLRVFKGLLIVFPFSTLFQEKFPFLKLYLVYNSLVLVLIFKSIIIHSDLE